MGLEDGLARYALGASLGIALLTDSVALRWRGLEDGLARYALGASLGIALLTDSVALRWRGLEDGLARYALGASLGIARLGVTCVVVTCGVAQSQGVRMIPRGDHGACITGLFLWFSDVGHFLGKWRVLVLRLLIHFLGKWWFGPLSGIMARRGF